MPSEPDADLNAPSGPNREPVVVGWRERIDLPRWGIRNLKAKIDTGARTSALHVRAIEPLENDRIRFEVVVREPRPGEPASTRLTRWIEADLVREALVKPSSGKVDARPVVETTLRLGRQSRRIELTLVCRKGMLCRMLVGRTALAGRNHVDPDLRYVFGNRRARLTELPPPASPSSSSSPPLPSV